MPHQKRLIALSFLSLAFVVTSSNAMEAGFQIERFTDSARDRPVLIDWWYPIVGKAAQTFNYGLGTGRVVEGAAIAANETTETGRYPLIVLSHGALGAARNYSWIAEELARRGFVVAGISHYGESYVFGADSIDPSAVLRAWERPVDVSAALTYIEHESAFSMYLEHKRVGFLGHSSGGATALFLAGARFDESKIAEFCTSPSALEDRGCDYAKLENTPQSTGRQAPRQTLRQTLRQAKDDYSDRRISAIVALDPALGPGFSDYSNLTPNLKTLIVGSVANDFLPFTQHAKKIAGNLRNAQTHWLNDGEGHFVYLNECTSELLANGISLCTDRPGVSRADVHKELSALIINFFEESSQMGN